MLLDIYARKALLDKLEYSYYYFDGANVSEVSAYQNRIQILLSALLLTLLVKYLWYHELILPFMKLLTFGNVKI